MNGAEAERREGAVITLNGITFHLVPDPAVRARDLAEHAVTLRRVDSGETVRVTAASLAAGHERPARLPAPRRRWKLRELAEEIAGLPDDPERTSEMVRFATLQGLLELPRDVTFDRA